MIVLLSIIAAALPAGVYVAIIYWFDRYEKEPGWLLAATFFWGAVPSIILALILNVVGSVPLQILAGPDMGDALGAVLIAPPVEETVKALALLAVFLLLRHEVDSILDGIIYGAMIGMGFAMVENIFYFLTVYAEGGLDAWRVNVFLRAIVFGLNHALFTSLAGLGLSIARFSSKRWVDVTAPIAGWMAAVLLHFIHNLAASFPGILCLLLPLTDWGGVLLMLAIIIWALVQEKRWIRQYLAEEVALGTLTPQQYRRAASGRARLRHRLHLLFNRGLRAYLQAGRFYHHCSELAYKKHHFALLGEPRSDELTQELRGKLSTLSDRVAAIS